jgi:gamma-glutamyltranspeptidase / glutathione hydrolase
MSALAVAAPSAAAADAAHQVAVAGGNAVDAALAAALVATVNEVGIVSLSSGAFVTVQPAGAGPAYTVDGWMDMPGRGRDLQPSESTWDVATEYGGGVDVTIGPGSVAVHGSLAAFGEAHRRDGRLPWAEVVAPALEVARRGFRLPAASRHYLDFVHDDIFGWDPASRAALHGADGEVTTEPVVLPDLAASLEVVAHDGPDALHRGDLADRIAADVLARGGILGHEDLAAYRPVVRPALVTRVGGWSLATTPPPSVGGACLTAMMRLMDGRPHGAWEPADVEHLVRVQRAVLGHRLDVLDHATDLETATAQYLRLVDRAHLALLESGSTAHVSATDRSGEACSVTFSSGYGSGMIAAGPASGSTTASASRSSTRSGCTAPRPAPGCCPTWRRRSPATTTARPWRSAPPAPTGSPPRSCRCWPASPAGFRCRRRSTSRGSTCTAPAAPTRWYDARRSPPCTSVASVPRCAMPTDASRPPPTRAGRAPYAWSSGRGGSDAWLDLSSGRSR